MEILKKNLYDTHSLSPRIIQPKFILFKEFIFQLNFFLDQPYNGAP